MRAQTNSYRYLPKYTRVLLQSNSTKGNPTRICGFSDEDIVRYNKAISSHMRNGQCHSALQLFDQMPKRTTVSWNAMISGYLSNDKFNLARKFFDDMPERDLHSYNIMINGYVRNRNLNSARDLFNKMPQRDAVSWNTMISAYAQNGYVDQAREVFDKMPNKNSISWNGILAAYIQNGRIECAFQLFQSKLEWDIVSWNAMIAGFLRRKRLIDARRLFEMIPEKDTVSWNTMISGYAQNGQLLEAKEFFDNALVRDVFTWTAMISGYVQNGMLDEARDLFDKMPEKNSVSWNAMMAGYLQHRRIDEAEQLFETMPCRNISSWNTMITAYAQNGAIDRAQHLFDKMPCRDSISWAAMIAGYTQGGYSEEALRLFIHMKRECELVTRSAFTCSLSTCADLAALECGRQLHGCLVKTGYETGCYVGNALLSMYCKCGNIDDAYNAFNRMPEKDIVTWNTMIAGYARHGFGVEALEVFETMGKLGMKPDDVTMVGVLSACSHAGLVDKGTEFFNTMTEFYGIPVREQHYTCMIDLLGRAGRLKDAQNLMKNMPFEADATMWGALLGASRIHRNATLGEVAAKRIFELEPENSGMYVLLSNLYASSGRWNDVNKMRILMKERGVKKVPGCSWIEVKNTIHAFSVGDFEHPAKEKIYQLLDELDLKMKKEGYISSLDMVLHDVEEEEKEHMLRYHSEKLAVAFGILNVPSGRPIRVIKNLRVCEDCHNAIKYISKIVGRLIILRDSNRFHHFENGLCSCGDYW